MWLASRNTKTGCLLSETRQADGILYIFLTMPTVHLLDLKSNVDSNSTIIILTVTQGKITNEKEFVSLNFLDC